jgi:vancomycin permeability regulator SanA
MAAGRLDGRHDHERTGGTMTEQELREALARIEAKLDFLIAKRIAG